MKFETYESYVEAAKKHFASKKDIKVPVEYLILSKELFDLFNGYIQFGVGGCDKKCDNCTCGG